VIRLCVTRSPAVAEKADRTVVSNSRASMLTMAIQGMEILAVCLFWEVYEGNLLIFRDATPKKSIPG